jgi:hypothetical protein
MDKPAIPRHMPKTRAARAECCTDDECSYGLRNQYFIGKRLTPNAFQVEQTYLNERRRLLNRAVVGWGVVQGYSIKAVPVSPYEPNTSSGRLQIGPGFALDEPGRELVQSGAIDLGVADLLLLEQVVSQPDPSSGRQDANRRAPCRQMSEPGSNAGTGCWLLSVHYAEQDVGHVTISDPCRCDRDEWDQVCETVRYSLRQIDCAECCAEPPCELTCGCGSGPCCDAAADGTIRTPHERHGPAMRGGCQCLCDHLSRIDFDTDGQRLCEIEEPCARVRVDLDHGVPLACVRLRRDTCSDWMFDPWIEACGPRRLVKRNDVLFDLIRGCDLTRISKIGWAPWHRSRTPVSWAEFASSFGSEVEKGRNVTQNYWVEFSRPVRADTLRADCFSMSILAAEAEGGWRQSWRVPIIGVQTSGSGVPKGCATKATLVVDAGWVDDALKSRKTLFNDDDTWVEIEVLGDYIVDCNGQTVDANAVGLSPAPTGNGAPGGTFCSRFRVAARRHSLTRSPEPELHKQGVEP